MGVLLVILTTLTLGRYCAVSAATRPTVVPGADCAPISEPIVTADDSLDHVFSGLLGPGWIGGDATYSTALPDGSEAFVFSDTLIGRANRNHAARIAGVAHNSELFGTMSHLQASFRGSYSNPLPLIPDSRGHGDQWQVASTYVENDRQLVFVNEFTPRKKNPFERFTGRSALAIFALPHDAAPSLQLTINLPAGPLGQWGNAFVQTASYTYVYGTVSNTESGRFFGMHVARVPRNATALTGSWQYWNGSTWVADEKAARTILTGNELTGVIAQPSGNGYEAVSIPGGLRRDGTIDLSYACSPIGPWSRPLPVYAIPQLRQFRSEIAYIPTFHQEFSTGSSTVISYNVNTLDGLSAVRSDVRRYQPRFLQLTSRSQPVITTGVSERPG